ncbi:MAG: redoxin domain-containing protein [Prevotella sp.]|nr:redoxin domain-containing protein [Prevotella sp.]
MKKLLLAAVCAVFMAAPLQAQTADTVQAKDLDAQYATDLLKPGTKALDFKLKTYDGKEIRLSQYRGSYVVLDFWASWCPDCRKDIPAMKALYEQFRDHGVQFIGISFDTDREAWAKTYWERYQMHWTQVSELKKWKKGTVIDQLYRVKWIPTMYLLDPSGNVVLGTVEINKLKEKLESISLLPKVSKTDVLPSFDGGLEAAGAYISSHQRYGIRELRSKVHAELTVVFNVEMDGSITGARVVEVRNVQGSGKRFAKMDAAKQQRVLDASVEAYKAQAVRLVNNMPKWNPGMQNGKPVQTRSSITVVFQP